ncbi:MAG: DUF4859 domain-containing protein [Bacteroidaceae bacterium]|nr:DUF4859 domain-containing protein [Bacteroidaceae bacterium]
MKRTALFLIYMTVAMLMAAQSSFVPYEWSKSTDSNGTTIYSEGSIHYYKHSKSSKHFDVYYGTGYGSTPPDELSSSNALYVNVADLLEKAESFFDLYVNQLKFADLTANSKLNRYKMIICLLHDTGWTATGSGYDNQIGALWVTPSTCHPVGQTIAHEIGHSFQYQVYSDLGGYAGFREAVGNGSTFWEQTAQWQSVQAYPNLMISQSIDLWQHNHNYAFTHEWQRYQSYWLHYYWTDKHGIDAVGRVWRGGTVSGEDPCQVYMRVFGVSAHDFYKEIYDYASHMATYDLDAIRSYGASSIGRYTYSYVDTDDGKIQVAYSSCPQSTGFNVIPLEVPSAGTTIKTIFSALPAGRTNLLEADKKQYHNGSNFTSINTTKYNSFSGAAYRGFRHGYVALLTDGTRVYQSADTVYSVARTTAERYKAITDTTTFVVPEGTQRLFFIVSPAPTQYIVHKWDEDITNDDQWPYQLEFENTDVVGHIPTVDLSDTSILPHDTLLNIYVGFKATTGNNYSGTTYTLSSRELRAIGEALRIQPADIASRLRTYSAPQANNTVHFLGLNATTGNSVVNGTSTANGYGHWFNASGNVCPYSGTSYVFSELNTSTLAFNIGQYPGRCRNGQVYQLGQAFRYKDANGNIGVAKLIFHIYIGGVPTDIEAVTTHEGRSVAGSVYDLTGRRFSDSRHLTPGIYIIDGRKVLIK